MLKMADECVINESLSWFKCTVLIDKCSNVARVTSVFHSISWIIAQMTILLD